MPELKSISENWGYQAESHVVRLLTLNKWQLIVRNFKTPIAEIDLVFLKDNKIYLVEVKRLNSPWRVFDRIQKSQELKLLQNRNYFSLRLPKIKTQAFVAWVDPANKISFVSLEG